MHRAALTFGITVAAPGELGHHALWLHAGCKHVPVVTIGGDDLIARLDCHLHADDDSLLADIEVTEAADEAHAVKLAGLLLEAANEQHQPIGRQLLFGCETRLAGRDRSRLAIAEPEIGRPGREAWACAVQVYLLDCPAL